MKMLFQELCRDSVGWDDELSGEAKKKWNDWVVDLSRIKGIAISRCVYDSLEQEVLECYLHGFGDASNKAYCAVVYFVYRTWDGVHVRLLTSRSRVAPLKELTIPTLELISARVLAKLISTVRNALEEQVTLNGSRYCLDSKTAICWIQNRGSGNNLRDTGSTRSSSFQLKMHEDTALEKKILRTLVQEERCVPN